MQIIESTTPILIVTVSLIGAILIALTGERNRNLREFLTILVAGIKFVLVFSMVELILKGSVITYTAFQITDKLSIAFKVDALGILFALTASFLWIITSFYSIGYMRGNNEKKQTRFYVCFAIALSATMGVAMSANLFTTFVFYEIITISTFPLVAHKGTPEALAGAKKYLTFLLATSIAFQLTAVIMTYNYAGTIDFSNKGILEGKASDSIITIMFILYMAGIAKAAMMPFHGWLPAAMVAPTPVSALLHAVAVVKTGVFVVVKVVLHIFGVDLLQRLGLGVALGYVASFTIIMASVVALTQDNLKRRLAYSTVGQLSYIVLGVSLLTTSGIAGSIMHITLHAFGKITLFFTAGAIYVVLHKTEVSQLAGIGRQMPFTMAAFTIGSLSMIGTPPLGGFISKWYILVGAVQAHELFFIVVLSISTILNACYFLPIVYSAFFKEPSHDNHHGGHHHNDHHDTCLEGKHIFLVAPLVFTAIGALTAFLFSGYLFDLVSIVLKGVR